MARRCGCALLLLLLAGCDSRGTGTGETATPGGGAGGSSTGVEHEPPRDAAASGGVPDPTDIPALSGLLTAGKLSGRIHGAIHDRGMYVFTYYPDPRDVFVFADFPMTAANDAIAQRLMQVKRHDTVTIKGAFIENTAPIKHIRLDEFQVTDPYTADEIAPKRKPVTRIPEDLPVAGPGGRSLIGKVHAVANDGRILVIEYGDAVVPVFVPSGNFTADLFRNDKIRVTFIVPPKPPRPSHLWLDTSSAKPLEVLERLADRNGQPFEAEGALVRFPKSPQITTDVFAVQVVDADNVSREYTLLNFDPVIFARIHDKLEVAWKARPGQGIDGRNKLVNPSIRVRAKGTFNLIDRSQANAQILLASPDDVTVTMLP